MKQDTTRSVRFQLRYQILPGDDVEIHAAQLAEFCTNHRVEEVVLFYAAEEWNNGLFSKEDEDIWFHTIERAKPILDKAGIITSLNPWMTVLHTDRGRTLPPDRDFHPMVSPVGEESAACASFACPTWQKAVSEQYERFAKLGFRVIWIEDDFRYHNHAPLTWGGGFEREIIELFSRKTGKEVDRETLVKTLLQPGKPHPWRKLWMETWRELQEKVAHMLRDAVFSGSAGRSVVGLMSSAPHVHSAEGRQWKSLFATIDIDGKVVHRPHFAAYADQPGNYLSYCCMMLDMQKALRPDSCEVAAEIENFPYTTWTKSDTQTWSEMAIAMVHGSDALFLNLFPFSGRTNHNPQIGSLLDRSRPAMDWIAQRFFRNGKTAGVGVLWKEDAQAHIHTRAGNSFEELTEADFAGPWKLLSAYGIPASANRGKINALFGVLAWAYTDEELRELLTGGLLLDGKSAAILIERGFGSYIGIAQAERKERDEALYSVEVVTSADTGVVEGHCSNANSPAVMYALEPAEDAATWTEITTPKRNRFGAGIVTFENTLGGRVATLATPAPEEVFRNYQRQTIMQNLVAFLYSDANMLTVSGGPYLFPLYFADTSQLVIVNGSPDPAYAHVLTADKVTETPTATLLAPLTDPARIAVEATKTDEGTMIRASEAIPYMGLLVLSWKTGPM